MKIRLCVFFLTISGVLACSPVSISRIGPTIPSRGKGCEVEVMPPGVEPPHPYRDIGVVHLSNCQEYTTGPCRKWLVDGVCELGGNVAYLLDPRPPRSEFDAVNYRVTAGVYVVRPDQGGDEEEGVCREPPPDEENPETDDCAE